MVATCVGYRRRRCSVLAIPPTGAPDSLPRARSGPASRVIRGREQASVTAGHGPALSVPPSVADGLSRDPFATRTASRRAGPAQELSFLPLLAFPSPTRLPRHDLANVQFLPIKPRITHVHVPGTFTVCGCPIVTDGLDDELARLQDQGTGGMAPLAAPSASPAPTARHSSGRDWGSDASPAVAVPEAGLPSDP